VEFIFYVFFFGAPIIPRLFAVIFHASSTSITAFGIAKNRFLIFYAIAIFLHFSNNFLAIMGSPWIYGSVAVAIVAFSLSLFLRFKTSSEKMIAY
jgi:hypothetical protein